MISTAHRLPKVSNGRRALIFKLGVLSDKQKLWANIAKVAEYNQTVFGDDKLKVDMTQLAGKLPKDRSDLCANYWKARDEGHRPKWWFDRISGQYL